MKQLDKIVNSSKYIPLKIFYFFLSTFFVACGDSYDIVSSRYINLGNDGISQGTEYLFDNLLDTLTYNQNKGYNILLSIRYSDLCDIAKIPLEMEYGSVNTDTVTQKSIEINLFDKSGKPIGKGNFGCYEETSKIFSDIVIDECFFISLCCKQHSIPGINSIGIIIKK